MNLIIIIILIAAVTRALILLGTVLNPVPVSF